MKLNNDIINYKVLKIPFVSKRNLDKFSKASDKSYKYSFEGIAYYVFDESMTIVQNTAKIIKYDSLANKKECKSDWAKKPSSKERNKLFDSDKLNIDSINGIIEKYNLTVSDSFSLITGHNPIGACIGSSFHNTSIIAFDEENDFANGWRFSTPLSTGANKTKTWLSFDGKIKKYKYSKVLNKNSRSSTKFTLFELEESKNKLTIQDIYSTNSEIRRLLTIYNKDLIDPTNWLEFKSEIEYLTSMNKKLYPRKKDMETLIASLLLRSNLTRDDKDSLEKFKRLISTYRASFRDNLKSKSNGIDKDFVLNKHEIDVVCEAAHILDVKHIKNEIVDDVICNDKLSDEDKVNKMLSLLNYVDDGNNGIFMDPTTHKYFDKDKLIIKESGEIINKTNVGSYNNIKLNLSDEQLEYIKKRNLFRKNI